MRNEKQLRYPRPEWYSASWTEGYTFNLHRTQGVSDGSGVSLHKTSCSHAGFVPFLKNRVLDQLQIPTTCFSMKGYNPRLKYASRIVARATKG